MKSPFPGMDPYLERHWRGVHATLVVKAQDALNEVLPGDLAARTEDMVYVESGGSPARVIAPDVRVIEHPHGRSGGPSVSGLAVAEPLLLEPDTVSIVEHYIEIIENDGGRVVTAIEFLSPGNNVAGSGRDAYLEKRDEFLASDTHLVEIDLVRAGDWTELLRPYRVPAPYRSTYRVTVRRADREKAELYRIGLRERLPRIPIPLRPTDSDVAIDLQTLVDRAYYSGRYNSIDYGAPCQPPLDPADAVWLAELLKQRTR